MATTKVAPAQAIEAAKETPLEERSPSRLIAESYLYDYKPTARAILTQIALMRMDEGSRYPVDAPLEFQADKKDWCWLSQRELGARVGVSECTVNRWIAQFKPVENGGVDGTIFYRDWYDDNHVHHAEYKINTTAFAMHQRGKKYERPGRYSEPSPSRGRFTSENQPKKKLTPVQDMDEE